MLDRHRNCARRLGLPELGQAWPVAPFLAVVGGGPSVIRYVGELRNWGGEIWAINGTWKWLKKEGIRATFYTIDPNEFDRALLDGVEYAVLADTVAPWVFDTLCDSHMELARLGTKDGEEMLPGTTSASTAITLACYRGHRHVTFFGCDSSYERASHVFKDDLAHTNQLLVRCGDKEFMTSPQMIMQAEEMAYFARMAPKFITIRGDGFLPALVEHGDYDVLKVSPEIDRALKERAA